jgi:hypothetical protein
LPGRSEHPKRHRRLCPGRLGKPSVRPIPHLAGDAVGDEINEHLLDLITGWPRRSAVPSGHCRRRGVVQVHESGPLPEARYWAVSRCGACSCRIPVLAETADRRLSVDSLAALRAPLVTGDQQDKQRSYWEEDDADNHRNGDVVPSHHPEDAAHNCREGQEERKRITHVAYSVSCLSAQVPTRMSWPLGPSPPRPMRRTLPLLRSVGSAG